MKILAQILIGLVLAGCAYNYNLGVSESTPVNEVAQIAFNNRIKVSTIDGKPFERETSIWVGGSHTVRLKPGFHTFTFTYNAVSLHGGLYTKKPTLLAGVLKAGKKYEISYSIEQRMIRFKIAEVKDEKPQN